MANLFLTPECLSILPTPIAAPPPIAMGTTKITVEEDDISSIPADGYPHIIDEIFGYAPRSTLMALRGVCKAWRDRVDILMAGHIVLAAYSPVEISGRAGVRIPGLKNRRNYARVLSGTRVVDLLGPPSLSPDRVKALRSQLNSVSVVRHRHHPAGRLPSSVLVGARTLVTFTTVTEKYEGGTFTGAAAVGPIPETCERFVLNVKFDPGRSWLSTASVQPFQTPAQLKSVTLVLTPIATHKEDENDHWVGNFVDSSRTKVMGMLNSFVLNMTLNIPRLRYTIVDAEQLRPAWLGFAPEDMQALEETWLDNYGVIPAREEVLVAEIRRQVKQGLKKWNQVDDETAERQVEEHVRFLTREQYREEVGEDEYLLETVE